PGGRGWAGRQGAGGGGAPRAGPGGGGGAPPQVASGGGAPRAGPGGGGGAPPQVNNDGQPKNRLKGQRHLQGHADQEPGRVQPQPARGRPRSGPAAHSPYGRIKGHALGTRHGP